MKNLGENAVRFKDSNDNNSVGCIYLGGQGDKPLRGPFAGNIIAFPKASPHAPFASAALLFALGYGPLPESRNKIPCFESGSPLAPWTSYYTRAQRTPDDIRELIAAYPKAQLGVVCGYNRLLSTDVDTDDKDIINAILAKLPAFSVAKRGSKGLTIFFRYDGNPDDICNRTFCLREADGTKSGAFCEVLWTGRKTTIPPTIHAKTNAPYQWIDPRRTLFNTHVKDLPAITGADLDALENAIKPWTYQPPPRPESGLGRPLNRKPQGLEAKRFRAYAQAALSARAQDLSGAAKGGRNRMLFDAVCTLGKFVHHGHLDKADMTKALVAACNHNGLEKSDGGTHGIMETIKSGLWTSRNDPLRELEDRPRPEKPPKEQSEANRRRSEEPPPWEPYEEQEEEEPIEWGTPEPIEAPLHPVPPFDEDVLLPDGLRNFVVDEAYRMCCPIEYVAVSTIAIVSSVIGAHCAIRPKRADNWLIVPNLWGAIVGEPSQMKSPAMSAAAKPLGRLIAKAMAEHKDAIAAAKGDKVVNEAKEKVTKKKIEQLVKSGVVDLAELKRLRDELKAQQTSSEEDEPVLRRFKTNDPTIEKLGELLRENPGGLLYMRDELVGLIASWEKQGREGDRQFFLEAWNGTDDYDTDRIGRGTIIIPNLCVSIFGGMQPDKLTAYLEQASDALGNVGLLQRFQLLVYPDPIEWEYRDRVPNDAARERVDHIFERLGAFDAAEWGASPKRRGIKFPYFFFDDAAQEVYIAWTTALHKKIDAESDPLIKQHLAKYDKLFPALALVFHMIAMALDSGRTEISEACAKRAAAWCDILEAHARRCYGLLADEGLRSAKALAKRLQDPELPRNLNPANFTARDIYIKGWRYLKKVEDAETALDWLENKGWVRKQPRIYDAGGRPTDRYTLNPSVRKSR